MQRDVRSDCEQIQETTWAFLGTFESFEDVLPIEIVLHLFSIEQAAKKEKEGESNEIFDAFAKLTREFENFLDLGDEIAYYRRGKDFRGGQLRKAGCLLRRTHDERVFARFPWPPL
jgi:hypothetical protein